MNTKLNRARLLLGVSCALFIFYFTFYILVKNPYQNALVGAVYEMLAFPMLALMAVIAIYSLMLIIKSKGSIRIYSLISFGLIISSILLIYIWAE